MRRKTTIRVAAIALILAGGFLFLRSAPTISKSKPCKGAMDQCCKKKADSVTWEDLSQQFFSPI